MILWALFGPWPFWGANQWRATGNGLLLLILLALLGWHSFGPVLHQ
jgi:hypothetical protein